MKKVRDFFDFVAIIGLLVTVPALVVMVLTGWP